MAHKRKTSSDDLELKLSLSASSPPPGVADSTEKPNPPLSPAASRSAIFCHPQIADSGLRQLLSPAASRSAIFCHPQMAKFALRNARRAAAEQLANNPSGLIVSPGVALWPQTRPQISAGTTANEPVAVDIDRFRWVECRPRVNMDTYERYYYICMSANCHAEKNVEHSLDGQLRAITYTSVHNHIPLSNTDVRGAEVAIDGVEIPEDGYMWRPYDNNNDNRRPRISFQCTTPGCNARKQFEKLSIKPNKVRTNYEGIHNHEKPMQAHPKKRRQQ